MAYILEDLGNNSAHMSTEIKNCLARGQGHDLTLSDGATDGFCTCVSGLTVDQLSRPIKSKARYIAEAFR